MDDDSWDFGLLFEVVGHRRGDDAVTKEDGYVTNTAGTRKRVVTTKGWDIKVKWENGETSKGLMQWK